MPILTNIRSIPVFSTPIEAVNWGRQYGLKGYHKHVYGIRTGYMAGATHGQVKKMYAKKNNNTTRPIPPPPRVPTPPPPRVPTPLPPTPSPSTSPFPLPPTGGTGGGY
tara:strand:- start:199 stop:522 length:324 start_codon:yes stop_codon:yes gene_type:complete